MELLDCYRVIRVRGSREEWEQAISSIACEVSEYVRRRLHENPKASHLTLTFGEPGYSDGFRRSLGRSVIYYADRFRCNGVPLIWQHNGQPFTPTPSNDGRRLAPIDSAIEQARAIREAI